MHDEGTKEQREQQERVKQLTTLLCLAGYAAGCFGLMFLLEGMRVPSAWLGIAQAIIWLPMGMAAIWAKAKLDTWLGLHRFY